MNHEQVFECIKEYVGEPLDRVCLCNDENDSTSEKIINRLLSLDKEQINDWLWNALEVKEEYDVERSSLSEKGKAFVFDWLEAKRKWLQNTAIPHPAGIHRNILKNINGNIQGQRVVLKPCSIKGDSALYLQHVKEDGDFLIYVTPDSGNDDPATLVWANTLLPFSFYIHLKDTDEEIGVISLFDYENKHNLRPLGTAYLHYYLYKQYRHQGYAYEAASLLIDAFFACKLKNAVVTEKHFEVEEKASEPVCIKIGTNGKNQASIALATKLGFVYESTDYAYKTTDGAPQDENNYCLDLNRYLEIHKK